MPREMCLYQSDTAVTWFATHLVTQATRAAGVLRSKTRNRGPGPTLGGDEGGGAQPLDS